MPIRIAITKTTSNGEQIVVDVCQWNPVTGDVVHKDVSELSSLADDALALIDSRVAQMHTRMLEAYELRQYCSPETWTRVLAILDIISGRVSVDTVARRWQSEVEETQELEAGRLAALNNVNNEWLTDHLGINND